MYGDTNLGATEDAVIIFLKTPMNSKIFDALKRHVYPEFALQFDSKNEEPIKEDTSDSIDEPPVNPAPKGKTKSSK